MGLSSKLESLKPLHRTPSPSRSTSSVVIQDTSARSPGRTSAGGLRRDDVGEDAILGGQAGEQAVEQPGLGVFHGDAERAFAIEVLGVEVHQNPLP
jgi:hypothetical protein